MTKVNISDKNITAFGGLFFTHKAIEKQGIRTLIDKALGERAPQATYSYSDSLLGLFYTLLAGGDCVEDISKLPNFVLPVVPDFKIPSPDTLSETLKSLAQPDEEVISEKGAKSLVNDCFLPNKLLKKLVVKQTSKDLSTLDVDTCVNENQKPDARCSYNKLWGYNPIVAGIGKNIVDVEARSGNASPKLNIEPYTMRVIEELKMEGIHIKKVRIDAAGYNFTLIDNLQEAKIKYYIRAVSCQEKQELYSKIKRWKNIKEDKETVQVGQTKWEGKRLVVIRKRKKDNAQLKINEDPNFDYFAIITNDTRSSSAQVVKFYAKRGGYERCFDYLNNDWGWNKLAFNNMAENAVWMCLCAFCNNLFEMLKTWLAHTFDWVEQSCRVKKFIYAFLAIPAKISKRARQTVLTLYTKNKKYQTLAPT